VLFVVSEGVEAVVAGAFVVLHPARSKQRVKETKRGSSIERKVEYIPTKPFPNQVEETINKK
jgi:hypothetical protein